MAKWRRPTPEPAPGRDEPGKRTPAGERSAVCVALRDLAGDDLRLDGRRLYRCAAGRLGEDDADPAPDVAWRAHQGRLTRGGGGASLRAVRADAAAADRSGLRAMARRLIARYRY